MNYYIVNSINGRKIQKRWIVMKMQEQYKNSVEKN